MKYRSQGQVKEMINMKYETEKKQDAKKFQVREKLFITSGLSLVITYIKNFYYYY